MSLAIYAANAIIGDERLPQLKARSATSSDAQGAESWGTGGGRGGGGKKNIRKIIFPHNTLRADTHTFIKK